MSDPELLLSIAASLGARLEPRGVSLHVEAPEPLPSELMNELRRHKAAILSLLTLPEEARSLVAWAAWLAECMPDQEVQLTFQETPQRPVRLKLSDLGRYLSRRLGSLSRLQSWHAAGSPEQWAGWRQQQIGELCGTLASLREALRPLGLAEIRERAA